MYLKWILFLILMHYLCACRGVNYEPDDRSSWIARMRLFRQDVKDCAKGPGGNVWSCLKTSAMKLFDEIFSTKTISIWRGIQLVRVADDDDVSNDPGRKSTLKTTPIDAQRDVEGFVDLKQIATRVTRVLRTHALQLNVKEVVDAILNEKDGSPQVHGTPRLRRHRNNMMIAMVFGVTALGAVLVPMGFQFLSVVSGKALLLAKMALLLASINGLKRIATSGVHYGLYQVPGESHGYGYYDRGDSQHPRNIHSRIVSE